LLFQLVPKEGEQPRFHRLLRDLLFMGAGLSLGICPAPVVAVVAVLDTGQLVAALGANQQRGKEEYPPGWVRFYVIGQEFLHGVEKLTGDNRRTEVRINSPVALVVADVQGLAEIPAAAYIVPVQAVILLDIRGAGTDRNRETVMLESVKDDCRVLRHNLQALFIVNPVAKRDFAANNGPMFYLAVQDNADSLPA